MTTFPMVPVRCDICDRAMVPEHARAYCADCAHLVCPDCDRDRRYRIVRHYFNRPGRGRTIARGLTLREARRHCNDPETSSSTATGADARRRTRFAGPWFDGYTDR